LTASLTEDRGMGLPRLEMWVDSPLTTIATLGETVITVVHTELTMEALRAAKPVNDKICASYPEGAVSLTVVRENIRLPDTELRNAVAEAMAATRSRTRAVARVFLGDGFWLSSVRSVLTAIELLKPYDLPKRTFGEVPDATAWLARTVQRDAGWAKHLHDTVEELIRAAEKQPINAAS
jgi:hypothetical protein